MEGLGTYCHPTDVEQTSCYNYVHIANKSILLSLTCDSTFHLLFSCFCTGLQVISSCSQPLNEKMKAKCHSYMRRKHPNNMSLSCLNRTILVTCLFHHIMHSPYPRESDEIQFWPFLRDLLLYRWWSEFARNHCCLLRRSKTKSSLTFSNSSGLICPMYNCSR